MYRMGPLPLGGKRGDALLRVRHSVGELLVPECRLLDVAFLRVEVDVEQAVALVIAIGPRELVLQAPDKVALDVDALGTRLEHLLHVLVDKVDALGIGDDAVCVGLGVLVAQAVFGDIDDGEVGMVALMCLSVS